MASQQVMDLRNKRMKIAQDMRKMLEDAANRTENPGLTQEEETRFDQMDKDQQKLLDLAGKLERQEEADKVSQESRERDIREEFRANPKTATGPSYYEQQIGFRGWAMAAQGHSREKIPQSFRDAAQKCGYDLDCKEISIPLHAPKAPKSLRHLAELDAEARDRRNSDPVTRATTTAQTITTTGGGHTIQNELMREIEIGLLAFGGVRQVADVIRTNTGATLPWPTITDTTNKSVILAINTGADTEALIFGQVTFSAYKYTTQQILVPMELMQDTAVDLVGLIGRALGERAGRGTNTHFTVGVTSDTQPNGIVTAAVAGTTSADVNSVTYANLVDQMHLVDPAYRMDPSAGWMFPDSTLSVLKKLLDGQNRPLWLPGLSGVAGEFPDTLLGKRYTINQDMASIATATTGAGAKKAILFGAFNRFKIRDVADMQIMRLNERYAEKGQTAWLGFHRHDSGAVMATTVTPPFKYLITKAT